MLRSRLDVRDLGRKSVAYLMTQISTTLGKGESQINQVSIHTHEGNQTDDINLSSKAQVKGRYAQLQTWNLSKKNYTAGFSG